MSVGQLNVELALDTSGMVEALRESQERLASVGREASRQMTIVRAEFGTATARMDDNADSTERLELQQRYLGQRLEQQRSVVDLLNDTYQRSIAVHGENADATQRLAVRLARATEEQARTEQQIRQTNRQLEEQSNDAEETGRSWSGLAEKLKGVGQKLSMFASLPIAGFFIGATEGTKELRTELGKLEVNAKDTGVAIEKVNEAYRTLAGFRDDLGANTETVNTLLVSGFNGEQLQQITEDFIAASVRFGETLNPEGLASDLQESLAQGEVTGMFGEMLNRLGVNLDEFNAKLATAKSNGTQLDLVLQTMASLGLTQTYNEYTKVNKSIIESNQAILDLQMSLADLAKKLDPIVTKITKFVTDMTNWFNGLSDSTKTFILVVAGIAAVVGPVIAFLGQLALVILGARAALASFSAASIMASISSGIATAAYWAGTAAMVAMSAASAALGAAMAIITSPITIVAGLIAGIITLGYQLYKNWDELKKLGLDVWKGISDAAGMAVDYMKTQWQDFSSFFISLWQSIWNPVKSVLNNMIEGINYVIAGLNKISISTPDWDIIPESIRNKTWGVNISKIPVLHDGGIFKAPFGQTEGLALLADGERVTPEGESSSQTVEHTGTITVRGVNDKNQLAGVVEIIVGDILRREVRI